MEGNEDSIEALQMGAEQGIPIVQFILGMKYASGEGIGKDDVKAAYWYEKSAEQGNVNGQYNIAWCYEKGVGVPVNNEMAQKLYIEAVKNNSPDALRYFARFYEKEGEIANAVALLKKAASLGDEEAKKHLKALSSPKPKPK